MISYPFESQNTGSASAPVYDRAITAEQERKFNKMRYTNGVFSTPTNGLMVQAKSGMTVTVKAGGCHIEGALGVLEADLDISISASNASQSRIDRIVARFDTSVSVRSLDIYKKEGVLSSNPQPPDIVRESNYYEIVLADIRVSAGTSEITNANITDQRENSDLCGLVVPAIPTPLDLDDIYLQYQASLDEYLELVATALDETTAGHLQGLIDSLTSRMTAAETKITKIQSDISISEETIAAFEALGWTPPVGGAVIESLLDFIEKNAKIVVEKGTSGHWQWEKYSDGTSKALYSRTLNLNFDTQYGGIFFSKTTFNEAYPQGVFKTVEAMNASTKSSGVGGIAFGNSDTTMIMKVWNGVAGADIEVTIMATVEGKWK